MPRTIITPTKVCSFIPALTGNPDQPFLDPTHNVRAILFDGRFGYYSVIHSEDTPVSHAAIAAATGYTVAQILTVSTSGGTTSITPFSATTFEARVINSIVLANHNLGYIPHYKVYDETGALLSIARPIQESVSGVFVGYRTVVIRATATQIILDEINSPGAAGLPALAKTYHVRVYQPVGPQPGVPGFLARPSRVLMAQGAVDSFLPFLRVALPGEAAPVKPFGRASDCNNGQFRYVAANGVVYDTSTVVGGSPSPYAGSFPGPNLLSVIT